ncbi:3-deoxy-7-phosphoheptulonate synthase [bacterium]|nr:3-deoxy-7-phosphoheptulonate synthase [bacterium]
MLIVMNSKATKSNIDNILDFLTKKNLKADISDDENKVVIRVKGKNSLDTREIELFAGVSDVIKISSRFLQSTRTYKPEDTIIDVKGVKFGGDNVGLIAGPCAVESYEQLDNIACALSQVGIKVLRGGTFKPRTSPYAFQGLGEEGLKILREVGDKYGMAVISEMTDASQIELFEEYVDIIQVGARNMHNYHLLKVLSKSRKPIVLKRGLASTVDELLMSAEYLLLGGNNQVILCERGIRTFEKATRNTLDLGCIPVIKNLSHLPIIVDPSHSTGLRMAVVPMGRAAIMAGCDGLIIEVHNSPETALCDGAQSLYIEQYKQLYEDIKQIAPVIGKKIN